MSQILSQNRSVQRADDLDIQSCSHFEKLLNLRTIFADNTDIVTACFAVPVFLYIKCAEFTKSVSRKQNFVCAVVSYHNFRPVYHRSKHESKHMSAKGQGLTISNFKSSALKIQVSEEVLHHAKSLGICHDRCIRICIHKVLDICCVVRLHMLNYQVIRLRAIQNCCDVIEPFLCEVCINSIHNCDLLILDHIRVVRHSIRHIILTFKQVYLVIIYTYI